MTTTSAMPHVDDEELVVELQNQAQSDAERTEKAPAAVAAPQGQADNGGAQPNLLGGAERGVKTAETCMDTGFEGGADAACSAGAQGQAAALVAAYDADNGAAIKGDSHADA